MLVLDSSVLDKTVNYQAFSMRFAVTPLRTFVDRALTANVSYFAVRRELLFLFSAAIDRDGIIDVPTNHVITIRTFLTSRDPKPSDQARLAFEVALTTIAELV